VGAQIFQGGLCSIVKMASSFLGVMERMPANGGCACWSAVVQTKLAITLSKAGQGGVAYPRQPLFARPATHDLNIAVNWKAGAVNCKVPV
jgi:hypothetical protein